MDAYNGRRMTIRKLLTAAALILVIALIFINRDDAREAFRIIEDADWRVLLLLPVVQFMSYGSNALFYRSFFGAFGLRTSFRKLYELALALNFVNQVLPLGGVPGVSYMAYTLKPEIPSGKSTLAQLGRYVLTYVSFSLLLVLAMTALIFSGAEWYVSLGLGILILFVIGSTLYLGWVLSDTKRFNKFVHRIVDFVDSIGHRFGRDKRKKPLLGRERIERALHDFHDGYQVMYRDKRKFAKPVLFAFLGNVFEVATVYVVFVALGITVNPAGVVLAYAVASTTGIVAVIPGAFGVFEAVMITALALLGVPAAQAFSGTLLYRMLNMAVFLPIGFGFYQKHLADIEEAA